MRRGEVVQVIEVRPLEVPDEEAVPAPPAGTPSPAEPTPARTPA